VGASAWHALCGGAIALIVIVILLIWLL